MVSRGMAGLQALLLMVGAGLALLCLSSILQQDDATALKSESAAHIFPGKSVFGDESGYRRGTARRNPTAGFFQQDRAIFSRGRIEEAKKKKPRSTSTDAVAERLTKSSRSAGNINATEPSGFLEGMVDEVEQVRQMPKKASEDLQESEASVQVAEQQLKLASNLRMDAANNEDHANELESHVADLEEEAMAKDERAQWFDKRAQSAEIEANEERQALESFKSEQNSKVMGALKQKMLMSVVDKVIRKVEGGNIRRKAKAL